MKPKTKSILKLIKSKPSNALIAMCEGLKKQSKRKNFQVNMGTFGDAHNKICYGCAATCTVQQLADKNIPADKMFSMNDHADALKFDHYELQRFEYAVDDAREGDLKPLFLFCKKGRNYSNKYNNLFNMHSGNWKDMIPEVEKLIKTLKKAGC